MEIMVKKWGNSAAVRIPASIVKAAHLVLDQPVEVREERGRIVIEPKRPRAFVLADLVGKINSNNLHRSINTGSAVGREIW